MFQRFTPFPTKTPLFLAWLVTIEGFAHALEGHGKHLHQFLRYLLKEAPSRNHLKSCDLTKSCTSGDDWNAMIHGIRDIDELCINNMFNWFADLVHIFGGLCPMTWFFVSAVSFTESIYKGTCSTALKMNPFAFRKIIWTKAPWNCVPALHFSGHPVGNTNRPTVYQYISENQRSPVVVANARLITLRSLQARWENPSKVWNEVKFWTLMTLYHFLILEKTPHKWPRCEG